MSNEHTSPEAVLAVPLDQPELIFSGTPNDIRGQWRRLAAQFHPDNNPANAEAARAFQHLVALREAAQARIKAGTWPSAGERHLITRDGRHFRLKYLRVRPFELGVCYVGRSTLAFAIHHEARELAEAAVDRMRSLGFADLAMRRELARLLPRVQAVTETVDLRVVILERDPELVLLADFIEHLGGRIEPRHVAWIVSGLEHLACYLGTQDLVHGAIGPDTVLVDPVSHRVALLGGWWYATGTARPLIALPERTLRLMPPTALDGGRAVTEIDLELIRLTARECLGDRSGTRLRTDPQVPSALSDWVLSAPHPTAHEDYAAWEAAREASFGPRRFSETGVTAGDIYPSPLATRR